MIAVPGQGPGCHWQAGDPCHSWTRQCVSCMQCMNLKSNQISCTDLQCFKCLESVWKDLHIALAVSQADDSQAESC